MSVRNFTVFLDATAGDEVQRKVSRPRAMTTRSTKVNVASVNSATSSGDSTTLDKENYHPLTGERAGPSNVTKKRKTAALAAKPVAPTKSKKEKDNAQSEPEQKKRKASASGAAKLTVSSAGKINTNKEVKGSGSTKQSAVKRKGSAKVTHMPKLAEEEESDKDHSTQDEIDSRCYELTVKPLADVSQAYEECAIFDSFANAVSAGSDEKVKFEKIKFGIAKASSVEPEIRDYFQPSQTFFCGPSTSSRLRAFSEEPVASRVFSTPERKQIYAAFTFCSPSTSSTVASKASRSGTISPSEEL